jgi:hypothetical protein
MPAPADVNEMRRQGEKFDRLVVFYVTALVHLRGPHAPAFER